MKKVKCIWSVNGICQAWKWETGEPLKCNGYKEACLGGAYKNPPLVEKPRDNNEWNEWRELFFKNKKQMLLDFYYYGMEV